MNGTIPNGIMNMIDVDDNVTQTPEKSVHELYAQQRCQACSTTSRLLRLKRDVFATMRPCHASSVTSRLSNLCLFATVVRRVAKTAVVSSVFSFPLVRLTDLGNLDDSARLSESGILDGSPRLPLKPDIAPSFTFKAHVKLRIQAVLFQLP